MSGVWGFIGIVAALVILAAYAGHCGAIAQDAQDANERLQQEMAGLRRYIDKLHYHNSNLMVENYELRNLVNQAHGQGFIPQWMRHGGEN